MKDKRKSKNLIIFKICSFITVALTFLFILGVANGMGSNVWSCNTGELNMDIPANKIFFIHSAGYVIGRWMTQEPCSPCWIVKRKDGKTRWDVEGFNCKNGKEL